MLRNVLHFLYEIAGHIFCRVCLLFWEIRDRISPPKEKTVLFVAHPDDDTLFFHTFMKEQKPYVVLMTTGFSLKRLNGFFRVMKRYGLRYRAYDTVSRNVKFDRLKKQAEHIFRLADFQLCATHNADGEYGHKTHRAVHRAVTTTAECPIYVPTKAENMAEYALDSSLIDEKEWIFRHIYTTESWVTDQYAFWVRHEHLELFVSAVLPD